MVDLSKLSKKELLELVQQQSEVSSLVKSDHDAEMQKLEELVSKSNPHQLPFSIKDDHTNVMLYTELNKRVGPLHPTNAVKTMARWKRAGYQLYTKPRTEAQIEAYKKTDFYKQEKAKHDALRKKRHAMSAKGKSEKLITEVARVTAEAVAGKKQ